MAEKTLLMMAAAGMTPIKVVPVEGRERWNGQTSLILRISPKWGEGCQWEGHPQEDRCCRGPWSEVCNVPDIGGDVVNG